MPPVTARLLLVDGTSERLHTVCATLRARGLTVDVVENGPGALAALESQRPDAILLETGLAGMSGMEVLDHIRASPQYAAMPVILIGDRVTDEQLLEGYKFGADYYLSAPVTPKRVLYAVGLVLGREFPE
jgi:two-component system KDP operon response regulator KdpE